MPRGTFVIIIGLFTLFIAACQPETPPVLPTLFAVESPTPLAAKSLAFWQPVTGVLSPDTVEAWQFDGQTGDNITIRALGRGASPALTLLDPSGQVIWQGETIQTELRGTGIHQIHVSSTGNGEYELGLAYTGQQNPAEVLPTPIPQVVGVPTPVPAYADLGSFIGELAHGQTVSRMFSPESREHVYTFNGETGRYITIQVNKVTGDIDPLLTLYSPEGMPLALDAGSAANNDAILRNIRLASDGLYTVQVVSQNRDGGYTLTFYNSRESAPVTPTVVVSPTPTAFMPVLTPTIATAVSGMELEDHIPVIGELDKKGDVEVYTFTTIQNELLTIGVLPVEDSPLIPRIEIIDPDGIPVAAVSGNTSVNNREALVSPFVPGLNGTYTVFVTGEGETFGKYRISYGVGTSRQNVMRGLASVDMPNLGAIPPGGVRDIWHTYLRQDDVITVTVNTQQGALNPVLDIVSQDGVLVGIDNNSGGERTPLINGVRIPQTGLYYFRIRPATAGNIGPYALVWRYISVGATPTPPEGALPVMRLQDTIDDSAYVFYPFQGRAGQRVRVRVVALQGSSLDPVLALLDNTGQVIAEADDIDGNLNPRLEITLPSDGTYTLRVNGYLSSGAFEVIVEEIF